MNNDLNLLLTAINDYDAYPPKQRQLLKYLLKYLLTTQQLLLLLN